MTVAELIAALQALPDADLPRRVVFYDEIRTHSVDRVEVWPESGQVILA